MKKSTVIKALLITSGLALTIRFLGFEIYRNQGKYAVIFKSAYNLRLPFLNFTFFQFKYPQRGEKVAFFVPEKGNHMYINEVVAVANEQIQLKSGKLFINDIPLPFETIGNNDYGPIKVPESHFFVLNHELEDLIDSRTFGPVPLACLKGQVWYE